MVKQLLIKFCFIFLSLSLGLSSEIDSLSKHSENILSNSTDTTITLSALDILNKAVAKLNGINTSFSCALKVQSISEDPIDYNFNFYSYWPNPDSLIYYNYIKFTSPVDYKNIEVWGYYDDEISVKKRMPINNEITDVKADSEDVNVVNFFNFIDLIEELKDGKFSIIDTELNNKDIYLIKSYSKNSDLKKKSTKFYIDKADYSIYKVEWTNKKGSKSKILLFEEWITIDDISVSSRIIYEDIKNGHKLTCKLDKIKINSINQDIIDLINIGFKIEN